MGSELESSSSSSSASESALSSNRVFFPAALLFTLAVELRILIWFRRASEALRVCRIVSIEAW